RAAALLARGVRRVFAIFVKTNEVCEWSRPDAAWRRLQPTETIEDPTLARPLPVRALLDAVEADRAVVRGLQAKHSPAIRELEDATRAQSTRRAIAGLCEVLEIELDDDALATLQRLDAPQLEKLHDRIVATRRFS
ncbi:MAG: hypothetical protein AB1Z98_25360, partial [Nannocystaceae bacterium]